MTTETTTDTFEADVCFSPGENVYHGIAELVGHAQVRAEVLAWDGPGGGWPVVRFTGSPEAIAFVRGAYDAGAAVYRSAE